MNNNNHNNICNNCGKYGHLFYNCKLPITSYGVICFRYFKNELQFLMIRRKNTFGYIDFINGRYSLYNLIQLQTIINEMSNQEKYNLLNMNFEELWMDLWNINSSTNLNISHEAKKKFNLIKNGLYFNNEFIELKNLINNSSTNWSETEWEFPKGRRNNKEKEIECALREFEEETGISSNLIELIENILPFEELFIGSNYKSYKYKYFLGYFNPKNKKNNILNFSLENHSNSIITSTFQQIELKKHNNKYHDLNNNLPKNILDLEENNKDCQDCQDCQDSQYNDISLDKFQINEVSKIEWKNIDKCLECIRPYNLEKKNLIINIYNILGEYSLYY